MVYEAGHIQSRMVHSRRGDICIISHVYKYTNYPVTDGVEIANNQHNYDVKKYTCGFEPMDNHPTDGDLIMMQEDLSIT